MKLRVLQVIAQMDAGGIEIWLMQLLRNVDPARVQMDFLVTCAEPGRHDSEIRRMGSAVIPCLSPSSPLRFARRFWRVLRQRTPYDAVHSHLHHFSGFVLALAAHAGIPIRIAHSHSDTSQREEGASWRRRSYLRLMEALVRRYATHGFAVSGAAAASLFGERWRDDPRWEVARCGVELGPFRQARDVAALRAELGIPADALVFGHVGRFDPEKNHALLVRIAAAVFERDARARFVLVGDGQLRPSIEADATRLGIRDRIVFTGMRDDVARLLHAFDAFVFPSTREGLPLVGLEAQAAGLPIVASDRITRELVVIPSLFTWRSPSDSPRSWADAALTVARHRPIELDQALAALESSEFSFPRTLRTLLAVYGVAPA